VPEGKKTDFLHGEKRFGLRGMEASTVAKKRQRLRPVLKKSLAARVWRRSLTSQGRRINAKAAGAAREMQNLHLSAAHFALLGWLGV
jgi:hypothetical protein